ncbi:MAG TPA: hypothetical protein DDX85_10735 [Nitrospiraceae bacterium]|nr:hypothetical protein [Nitrospiraceae bacterium]
MKKIYTIRDITQQQAHMWNVRQIEDEVMACEERGIKHYFSRYLPKDKAILEAGCGLGAWVIFLSEKGYHIAGIDHDRQVIERLKRWKPALNVEHGDIGNLRDNDNSLGAYISLGVVEHFEEGPDRPLQEAYRVLEPGGTLILTVPYNNIFRKCIAHPLRSIYLLFHRIRKGKISFAEYRYSVTEVKEMVEKEGFQAMEMGLDDFIDKSRSLTIWSEFPFLQSRKYSYTLNTTGKILASIMNFISRRIAASGICIIARKPLTV